MIIETIVQVTVVTGFILAYRWLMRRPVKSGSPRSTSSSTTSGVGGIDPWALSSLHDPGSTGGSSGGGGGGGGGMD